MKPASNKLPESLIGMTTPTERAYLLNYTQTTYTGQGEVVDLGSWLGSLTIPLLIGLRQNPTWNSQARGLHAYDLFTWADWMERYYNEKYFSRPMKNGDSFLGDFSKQVTPYDPQNRLVIHAGDLNQAGWKGTPIELLVVDVMKSLELANTVLRDFYPFLIPGVSHVMHQDFIHYYTPWIHLIHYRLRDYFEPIQDIPQSSSIVFRLKKSLPAELTRKGYTFADFKETEIEEAFAYSCSLLDMSEEWRKAEMAAVHAMAYYHQNQVEKAQRVIKKAVESGIPLTHGLKLAQDLIDSKR